METTTQTTTKPHLNFSEACDYLGFSQSYLYKLTMRREVPFYKPSGKKLFFLKQELDDWITSNPVVTAEQIEQRANDYVTLHNRR